MSSGMRDMRHAPYSIPAQRLQTAPRAPAAVRAAAQPRPLQRLQRQYLYFCTSKGSKLSTCARDARALLQALLQAVVASKASKFK